MKRIIIFSVLALFTIANQVKSQGVIAVTSPSGQTSVYNLFQVALDNANAGDYIYLPGGTFSLTSSIKKKVNIIGAGHYPDSTVCTNRTVIEGNITIGKGANNLLIEGLYVIGNIIFNPNERSDDVIIRRCNMTSIIIGNIWNRADTARCYNPTVIHNVIRSNITFSEAYGFTIKGNIISGQAQECIYHPGIFENNVFLNVGDKVSFSNLRNVTFKNNIFMNNQSLAQTGYASYGYDGSAGSWGINFINNLFVGKDTTISVIPLSALRVGNVYKVDPTSIFVKQSGTAFDYTHDYNLISTSPGKNAGDDGKDVGVFGSSDPYKKSAVPVNPHIVFKDIPSATLPNGTLQIRFKVSAQDK